MNESDEIKRILSGIITNIDGDDNIDNVGESSNQTARSTKPNSIPPSYSTVIRESPPTLNPNRNPHLMEQQNIYPYSRRIPPPAYGDIDRTWLPNIGTNDSSFDDLVLGSSPVFVWCQRCSRITLTRVYPERMRFAHFAAIALCIFGCWPCCLLPYCMDSCKITYHFCSNCNYLLGIHKPW